MEVKVGVKVDITPMLIFHASLITFHSDFSRFTSIVFTPSLLSLLHSIDYSRFTFNYISPQML